MAVYREGYTLIEDIEKSTYKLFYDAADVGAKVKKDDVLWKALEYAIRGYVIDGSRKERKYSQMMSVSIDILLVDEWAVSDERKTLAEATDRFTITYNTFSPGMKNSLIVNEGHDGFLTVKKLKR